MPYRRPGDRQDGISTIETNILDNTTFKTND